MGKIEIQVTKHRWIRKPLVRKFTVDLNDVSGYLHIDDKQRVNVKVKRL